MRAPYIQPSDLEPSWAYSPNNLNYLRGPSTSGKTGCAEGITTGSRDSSYLGTAEDGQRSLPPRGPKPWPSNAGLVLCTDAQHMCIAAHAKGNCAYIHEGAQVPKFQANLRAGGLMHLSYACPARWPSESRGAQAEGIRQRNLSDFVEACSTSRGPQQAWKLATGTSEARR